MFRKHFLKPPFPPQSWLLRLGNPFVMVARVVDIIVIKTIFVSSDETSRGACDRCGVLTFLGR